MTQKDKVVAHCREMDNDRLINFYCTFAVGTALAEGDELESAAEVLSARGCNKSDIVKGSENLDVQQAMMDVLELL